MMPGRRYVGALKEGRMPEVHILAIDLAKRRFQICAADRHGAVLCNRMVSLAKLEHVLHDKAPCIVAMEACATSDYRGRFAQGLGREVRLIPRIYVKPFVKRQKNDSADAASIAEARPCGRN
jgi:transposase